MTTNNESSDKVDQSLLTDLERTQYTTSSLWLTPSDKRAILSALRSAEPLNTELQRALRNERAFHELLNAAQRALCPPEECTLEETPFYVLEKGIAKAIAISHGEDQSESAPRVTQDRRHEEAAGAGESLVMRSSEGTSEGQAERVRLLFEAKEYWRQRAEKAEASIQSATGWRKSPEEESAQYGVHIRKRDQTKTFDAVFYTLHDGEFYEYAVTVPPFRDPMDSSADHG